MTKLLDTFVSAVLVCDDRSQDISERVLEVSSTLRKQYANYEILLVDNGLASTEVEAVKKLLPKVACVRVIRLAKPVVLDTAVFAGVEAAIGDHICVLYNLDPPKLVPEFVEQNRNSDIVFGVARNLKRRSGFESVGARIFYWYNRKYLRVDIPKGSTFYVCVNRTVANALTRSDRYVRHFRHLAKLVGFSSTNLSYDLPDGVNYANSTNRDLTFKAIDIISSYSSHPLRALSYFAVLASLLNAGYGIYVVIVNLSIQDVARGWTTLSLQSSLMFFLLFMLLAILAEYIGKILLETRKEPSYHVMQELSSTISLADEARRNVTK